jgi:hypothetical protein
MGTTDVVVQQNNEGPMIFGESANTNKKGTTVNKTADPKYYMPRWCPSGFTRSQKSKITVPQSKGESGKGGGKNIQ